jgi:hypothetical protein
MINKILNISKKGYKKNSPHVNRPFNVIPSNKITMKEDDGTPLKKGPILGIGIGKILEYKKMMPGKNYKFSDNVKYVIEKPLDNHQLGGSIPKYQTAGETPNKILTLKDNSNWFDSRARYSDNQTYDDQIRERVYSGNWGYNPYTQTLHKLNTNQKTKPTEEQQLYKEDKKVVQAHLKALKNQDKKWWEDPSYKPTQKERDEFIKMGVEKTINNPAFTTAAYFTPPGMAIGAMQGATHLTKDLFSNNLGLHSLLDAAMVAPAVGPSIVRGVKQMLKPITPAERLAMESAQIYTAGPSWESFVNKPKVVTTENPIELLNKAVQNANKKLSGKGLGIKKNPNLNIELKPSPHDPKSIQIYVDGKNTGYIGFSPPSKGTQGYTTSGGGYSETPLFGSKYDYPYMNLKDAEIGLYKGVGAESKEAINQALKELGSGITSGGIGHSPSGQLRYFDAFYRGNVEPILNPQFYNPAKARNYLPITEKNVELLNRIKNNPQELESLRQSIEQGTKNPLGIDLKYTDWRYKKEGGLIPKFQMGDSFNYLNNQNTKSKKIPTTDLEKYLDLKEKLLNTEVPSINLGLPENNYKPSNIYKYAFAEPSPEGFFGLATLGSNELGLEGTIGGYLPYDIKTNPYFKGDYFINLQKNLGKFSIGAGANKQIFGYPDQSGNFTRVPSGISPNFNLRFNFQGGGSKKEHWNFITNPESEAIRVHNLPRFNYTGFDDPENPFISYRIQKPYLFKKPIITKYDDDSEEYTFLEKGTDEYKDVFDRSREGLKNDRLTTRTKNILNRGYGNKEYIPSQEVLDRVAYQKANWGKDKMGDTDILENMIIKDITGNEFITNPKEARKITRYNKSPLDIAKSLLGYNMKEGGSIPKYQTAGQKYNIQKPTFQYYEKPLDVEVMDSQRELNPVIDNIKFKQQAEQTKRRVEAINDLNFWKQQLPEEDYKNIEEMATSGTGKPTWEVEYNRLDELVEDYYQGKEELKREIEKENAKPPQYRRFRPDGSLNPMYMNSGRAIARPDLIFDLFGVGKVAKGITSGLSSAFTRATGLSGLGEVLSTPAIIGGRALPGVTLGNALDLYAASQIPGLAKDTYTNLSEGNYWDAAATAGEGALYGLGFLNPMWKQGAKSLVDDLPKPIRRAANYIPGLVRYVDDVIGTTKMKGKFSLPKYQNTYRIEHPDVNMTSTADDVTGRWFLKTPNTNDTGFYLENLKDPTGKVIKNPPGAVYGFSSLENPSKVRIMTQRLPEYKINQQFGAGMPEEARIMSMGRGDMTNAQLDEVIGAGAGDRFTEGKFLWTDYNAMETAPFLYHPSEGILNASQVNKLRTGNTGILSGGKSQVFDDQAEAFKYFLNESKAAKNVFSKFRQRLPFQEGGSINDYKIGDEVDKDTYLRLKKLGYKFE